MTSNSTEPPIEIPPLTGLSEEERDKYLLIATFLSVLIVFGIIVAIMHRKCRESLYKGRAWVISKTVRHRPNFNRTVSSTSGRTLEVSLSDPSNPVYSKEVYAPVCFFLGNSDETSSSSGKSRKDRRLRNSGTDPEDDSGISVISTGQNIPMCSLSKKCFNINRDVNDNYTLTYNPSSISLDPDVNLVRVLAPEVQGNEMSKSNDNSRRPKLRRSSTVIDKMNFLSGYMPSSREEDYTVITLTDESEPDIDYRGIPGSKFNNDKSIQRTTFKRGCDNPVFQFDETGRSKSLSDFELYDNEQTSTPTAKKVGFLYNDIKTKRQFPNHIVHKAEVHVPLKTKPISSKYTRSDKTRTNTRTKTSKRKPVIRTIDKESQQLYKRVMRERIQEIIYSDSSSVKSDQTFVRSTRKKKHKMPSRVLGRP